MSASRYSPYHTDVPIWKGRRGLINTAACAALGLTCALALFNFVGRAVIDPACRTYAGEHRATYLDFQAQSNRRDSGIVCRLTFANGKNDTVRFRTLVPFLTDAWVGFAMALEITVPALTILFAVGRYALYRRSVAASSPP